MRTVPLTIITGVFPVLVGMKPLSERDENNVSNVCCIHNYYRVGMKPLSERDENSGPSGNLEFHVSLCRNEATL